MPAGTDGIRRSQIGSSASGFTSNRNSGPSSTARLALTVAGCTPASETGGGTVAVSVETAGVAVAIYPECDIGQCLAAGGARELACRGGQEHDLPADDHRS